MNQQLDYQYAPIPKKLMYCLDRNCKAMLFALVDLTDYYSSNKIYRSNEDLQKDTDLSKNLVIATLVTLYRQGLIDVDCVGKGTGRKTNIITVHTEKFKDWEKYTFDEVRTRPELKIDTVKYKGSGFKADYANKGVEVSCYSQSQEVSQTSSQQVSQKVNTIEETIETQSSKENKLSKEIKNESQKVNTCNEICESKCERLCDCICEKVSTITDTTDITNTINTIEDNILININTIPSCDINIEEEEKSQIEFDKDDYPIFTNDDVYSTTISIDKNSDILNNGYECFDYFLKIYPSIDYQLLMTDSTQFLENHQIKIGALAGELTTKTGIYFSKEKAINLLKQYVENRKGKQYQEIGIRT